MKLDPKYRPELCVSDDETRYNLGAPYLDTEERMIVATDGHRLVCVPVQVEDGDTSSHLEPATLAVARGEAEAADPPVRGKFPDWREIRRMMEPSFANVEGVISICLNAEYLASMAKAMGTELVTIRIQTAGEKAHAEPYVVLPYYPGHGPKRDPAYGFLMPLVREEGADG